MTNVSPPLSKQYGVYPVSFHVWAVVCCCWALLGALDMSATPHFTTQAASKASYCSKLVKIFSVLQNQRPLFWSL